MAPYPRREFLKQVVTAATLARSGNSLAASVEPVVKADMRDLRKATVVVAPAMSAQSQKAIAVLLEEAEKRSGLRWPVRAGKANGSSVTIYAALQQRWKSLEGRAAALEVLRSSPGAEGCTIRSGQDSNGQWIAICGADERGLLFGVGKFLRSLTFGRQSVYAPSGLNLSTGPKYRLRGHQLGYRPKTNAYDAWTVSMWDQYIRDLAIFGTNAIELAPPRSDDAPDSPHFPIPPERMMAEMSRIADSYSMDVWIWYPAMDKDYSDPRTVESAIGEWARIFKLLPRIDAVFVPGGDPGETSPRFLLALLEKQKQSLRQFHPHAQMWTSPQGFHAQWMDEFFAIVERPDTAKWLDGVVYGPQSPVGLEDMRRRIPETIPIRLYPDITHSVECQYPVPEWDVAFALTEGREVINPRPEGQANILRRYSEKTIGFLTYSEGCNDDVNKFVWSVLGWDPQVSAVDALRDFGRYFLGNEYAEGFAQGLLALERNWCGPLATNSDVPLTLAQFQDLERAAPPALLENWRFQQGLYRAYYDAYVRSRLIDETARVQRARDLLSVFEDIGWLPVPPGIGDPLGPAPPNGLDPTPILAEAETLLSANADPPGRQLRGRVRELGEALFQSVRMQLAVTRYQGEAVERGTNLETLDYPVSDIAWMRQRIAEIQKLPGANEKVKGALDLLKRADPGPGGFYDQLGNPASRPHLLIGVGPVQDPEFRSSALTGFNYPDELGNTAPIAWKAWAESLFDATLQMRYTGLDPHARYRLRVVYSGDEPKKKIRLSANRNIEIHPLLTRPWPPKPMEFDVPAGAITGGELHLAWSREPGLGGNGRGCQVSEVWLFPAR
jgi:hypothetical protein